MARPKPNPELIAAENPEWLAADFKKGRAALPPSLSGKLGVRGPQKHPTKEKINIRLSPAVLDAFRAAGAGWQTRIDEALQDWLKTHQPA